MMQSYDPACLGALQRLLARPDPPEMPRRMHVYQCAGEPDRRETRLPGILMGWLQRRHLDVDIEEPLAPARRIQRYERAVPAYGGLRLLRPTGSD